MVLIYKNGDIKCLRNYTPIILLFLFSKTVDKKVKRRKLSSSEKRNFCAFIQFGFRIGLCIEDALISCLSDIYDLLNAGLKYSAFFIDIKKLFGTVDYGILLNKLWDLEKLRAPPF